MTKEKFMYIVGINDEEQLENIMLLMNESEPEDGDWTDLLKKWYEDLRIDRNRWHDKYFAIRYK